MTDEFDYYEFWAEEKAQKIAENEAKFYSKEGELERLAEELIYFGLSDEAIEAKVAKYEVELNKIEEIKSHLSDPEWIAAENARRAKLNEEYRRRYPLVEEIDLSSQIAANNSNLARAIFFRSPVARRDYWTLVEDWNRCGLILGVDWRSYKYLTNQEISEMTNLRRQMTRWLVGLLLDSGYLREAGLGFQKVRKAV